MKNNNNNDELLSNKGIFILFTYVFVIYVVTMLILGHQ